MALINCPECGKEVSDTIKICPHCGYGLRAKKQISKKGKLLLILVPALICILVVAGILTFNSIEASRIAKIEQEKRDLAINAIASLIEQESYAQARSEIELSESNNIELPETLYKTYEESLYKKAEESINNTKYIEAKSFVDMSLGHNDFTKIQYEIDKEALNRIDKIISLSEKAIEDYQVTDLSSSLMLIGSDNVNSVVENSLNLTTTITNLDKANKSLQEDIPKAILSEVLTSIYEKVVSNATQTTTTLDVVAQTSTMLGIGTVAAGDISDIKTQLSDAKVELANAKNQFNSVYKDYIEE